jgi:hypothetical protein
MRRAGLCLALAGAGLAGAAPTATPAAPTCSVTKPNGNVPSGSPTNFFGNGRLATYAYGIIEATTRTLNLNGSVSEKFPWWGAAGIRGKLHITGKRRQPTVRPLRAKIHESFVPDAPPGTRFWATRITFPAGGCWTIKGRAGGVALSLVVLVTKPHS